MRVTPARRRHNLKKNQMPRDDFYQQVKIITDFDRQKDYGDGVKRLAATGIIVEILNTQMSEDISPCQSHIITMLVEKLTRAACNPDKADTWIDIAGYARFGYEASRQK